MQKTRAMYQNVEEYVRANGYEVSDLTKEELREAKKEMEMVNRGEDFVDGVFSGFTIAMRKASK